jgi:hypothetical protein
VRAGWYLLVPGRPVPRLLAVPPLVPDPAPPDALHADAVALLRALSGPHGIHASLSATANYRAVFARDAVMAGVAGLLLDDAEVTAGLVRTLERLRDLQGAEGQIASNYEVRPDPAGGGDTHVSFGAVVPRLDAPTWYLVGVALAARAGALDPAAFGDSVRRTVRLLDALEYNGRHLVYVPAGGNWADEYVTEGYTLYDQVLRAWGLALLAGVYAEPAWAAKSAAVGGRIAEAFWPAGSAERGYPIAAFTPLGERGAFDLAACGLLALSGAAPALGAAALDWTAARYLARGAPPPAFAPVVREGDPDWPALRRYHLFAFRNRPHEYHNGGVWPIWLGWLALALGRAGRAGDLARLRAATAERLAGLGSYAFEEYLHGETYAPGGTPQMAYTATGLVFLAAAGGPRAAALLAP